MLNLNSRERIINTFDGKELDRLPIFDIIHNMEFIEHMRTNHPLQFSAVTYTDESGEHNLYAEHPEEYFRTIQSTNEIKKYYSTSIPKDLVGTDFSANELRGNRNV